MTLREMRCTYTVNLAKLIAYIVSQGYEVAIGQDGQQHMKGSLHYVGLANDLLIYKDGTWMQASIQYKFAGDFWKGLHPLNRWGGDFPGDGNHFSMEYSGKK
jgi:hypothetical protein